MTGAYGEAADKAHLHTEARRLLAESQTRASDPSAET
jgi:hypothetical protein